MSSVSATDVITYIGVPLAVLGVLPILYNTFLTLVNVSRIKRALRHSQLTALTRSDVVNRVIEIELPRYAVTPWDRFQNRREYWSLSRHPSAIPGGSWTTFNWKTNAIGIKTQRVEYADQLRQPQVEVAFDELVCYLLDLGAVPDPHGWKLLRSTGLWTPVGCALMKSPDGQANALTIAPLDDSDGNLSLAAAWSPQWTTRDYSHLPPYWVRLPAPPPPPVAENKNGDGAGNGQSSDPTEGNDGNATVSPGGEGKGEAEAEGSSSSMRKQSIDSAEQEGRSNAERAITCQISIDGIVTALTQEEHLFQSSSLKLDSLYIEHLRIRGQPGGGASGGRRMDGVWFASAATAYGTSSQTVLWNYRIPEEVLAFARRETVPCGVLVMLGVVDESATPEWATQYHHDHGAALELHVRRHREQQDAMAAEQRLPPAQREQAARERLRREAEQRMQDLRDKSRADAQRRETKLMEALQSPKWDTRLVAEHNLAWLRARGHAADPNLSLRELAGTLLHRMVLDGQFAAAVCSLLDRWKAWADIGGMKKADYYAVRDAQVAFAQATLLVAVIRDNSAALEGTLSTDLQECLSMWRKVRLG